MDMSFILENQAFLITDFYQRRYFSSVLNSEGFVLMTSNKTFYYTDARYFYALKEKLKGSDIQAVLYNGLADIENTLKQNNIISLGVDYERTTVKEYNDYLSFGLELFDCGDIIKDIRSVKTDEEIQNIKTACEICERSFFEALSFVRAGITENELKDVIKGRFIENGAEGESFDTIVAFNENSAVPHHETGNKILTNDSVILIDTGCVYKGYMSDMTRTVFFGTPTEGFVKAYNAVWGANELAEKLIRSGCDTKTADGYARDYLKNNSLDKYFTHSLGHGVGLEIHEAPTLSPKRDPSILKENMVFTVEPGVYFDGEFGIRIEDTVVIKNGKVERLFTDSKDLITIK